MSELSTLTLHKESSELDSGHEHQQNLADTVKVMERLHAAEIFSTPEHAKEFLDSLEYDEFKQYISIVNGIERSIPTTERGQVSGSHVQSGSVETGTAVSYRPPHTSLRDPLLQEAFIKAQQVDSPELAALTLGLSINAIHYFADGNGRTARMTYALLSHGYNGSPIDREYYSSLLENTSGREVINPNPAASGIDQIIRHEMTRDTQQKYGYEDEFRGAMPTFISDGYPDAYITEHSPDTIAAGSDIDETGRQKLYRAMESGGMSMISLMASYPPERVKEYVHTSHDGTRTFIDGNAFLPTLSDEEIDRWWKTTERAITVYVRKIINIADRDEATELAAYYSR